VTEPEPDWRQRKKAETRDRIRGCALRLFLEQGYEATTVEQIAAAAGVSQMTFFRYFPAKEDVALADSYDPMIARLLEQTPADWPLLQRIRVVLVQGLAQVYETDRDALLAQNRLIAATPALRDRLWADKIATQQLFLRALGRASPATPPACGPGSWSRPAWPRPAPPSSPGSRTTAPPNCPICSVRPSRPSPTLRNRLPGANAQVAGNARPPSVHWDEFDFVSRATISRAIVGCLLIDNILWPVRRCKRAGHRWSRPG
jgi:AcrR family transcriptional regulator